jgi:hypothetical protein
MYFILLQFLNNYAISIEWEGGGGELKSSGIAGQRGRSGAGWSVGSATQLPRLPHLFNILQLFRRLCCCVSRRQN